VATPPSMPPPPPPPPRWQPALRGGWARRREGRLLGGVAAGIAQRVEVDVLLVRIGFVVLTAAGGLGVAAYLLLWLLLPEEPGDTSTSTTASDRAAPFGAGPLTPRRLVALGLMALGGLLLVRRLGLWLGDGLVWPLVLVAAGSAIVWARGVGDAGARASRPSGSGTPLASVVSAPVSPLRIALGTLLALAGIAGFLAANVTLSAVRDLVLALIAATIGLGLLLAPWLWRLGTQLTQERRERIRQEERAELAAHLHDSVLQTLALIQRASDEPRRMVALARRQERELRSWLYSDGAARGHRTLAAAVRALGDEVESVHGLEVEVVVVGDAERDARLDALLGAIREACVNAAKHADVDAVDVYVEVEDDAVVAFVRDRGVGFDPDAVAVDRHGIRESIVRRVERHAGTAHVLSRPGEGTEVELRVPREREAADADVSSSDA
jgi:signal transduction histidine kinase/phage shock protein PspC (stress-responsive transcriptional regulator)